MFRSDNREVTPIERRDRPDTEPFGESDYGSVDCTQWQIVISRDELRDPLPIGDENRLREKVAGREISQESHFRFPSEAFLDEVRDFGDDELWNDQRPGMRFEKLQTHFMVGVFFIDVGVERT